MPVTEVSVPPFSAIRLDQHASNGRFCRKALRIVSNALEGRWNSCHQARALSGCRTGCCSRVGDGPTGASRYQTKHGVDSAVPKFAAA